MDDKSPVLILDNNDSFTYNLVQLVESVGVMEYSVSRSSQVSLHYCASFSRIIVSPGPGLPSDFPLLHDVIRELGPTHAILGVCLGHQAIATAYGGSLTNLPHVNHGISTLLHITDPTDSLFSDIHQHDPVGLYHSWVVDPDKFPDCLQVTAISKDGNILGLRHRTYRTRGVQFHPESIMTPGGKTMIRNWFMLCALFLVFLITSCRDGMQKADYFNVFRYNEASNITSLDPAFARDQANIWAVNQLYNGLLQFDDSLTIRPCIAHTWHVSGDGLEYTFYLRQDVFFHDDPCFAGGKGRRVKAGDFVYSFNRIRDPVLASAGAWVFGHVANQDPFVPLNDSTLIIRMQYPFPPFSGILAMIYCSVIPEEAVICYGNAFRKHPVGTGPFRFGYWKEGVKLVLVKNPGYFEQMEGRKLPFLDAVSISFMADKQAAFMQFLRGNLDFISGIEPSYKDELLTSDGKLTSAFRDRFQMETLPYLNTEYLGILVDTSHIISTPLQQKLVRQALNHAFDRRKMIRYLRNSIGTPGLYGIVPPGMPGFDTSRIWYDYQPEKAAGLLREAGYTSDNPLPSITLMTTPDYLDICKYIQHQVASSGINMEIEVVPAAAMKEMKAQAKIPFFRASWIADYPDAENYLSLFYSPNFCPAGPNYTHYRNDKYDRLFEEAMQMADPIKRYETYRMLETLIMEDSPVVVLYYDQVLRFFSKEIRGLGINPLNMLTLKTTRKVKEPAGVTLQQTF